MEDRGDSSSSEELVVIKSKKNKKKYTPKQYSGPCEKCGITKRLKSLKTNMCNLCYRKYLAPKITCIICKKEGKRWGVDKDDNPICQSCSGKMAKPKQCTNCSKITKTGKKDDDGNFVCRPCSFILKLRPTSLCIYCKEDKPVCYRKNKPGEHRKDFVTNALLGDPVCKSCYTKYEQKEEKCFGCGEETKVHFRALSADAYCTKCYGDLKFAPNRTCGICTEHKPVHKNTEEHGPVCTTCYNSNQNLRPIHECDDEKCNYSTHSVTCLEAHVRTHTSWHKKSKAEQQMYEKLESKGWKREYPSVNPSKPPERNIFWYNARPWTEMVGTGGGRLECDFMLGIGNEKALWLELHGPQHYKPMDIFLNAVEHLEKQQKHDQLRRDFVNNKLMKIWPGLKFEEIPYTEFGKIKEIAERVINLADEEKKSSSS